jgi:hypothetical protein
MSLRETYAGKAPASLRALFVSESLHICYAIEKRAR